MRDEEVLIKQQENRGHSRVRERDSLGVILWPSFCKRKKFEHEAKCAKLAQKHH